MYRLHVVRPCTYNSESRVADARDSLLPAAGVHDVAAAAGVRPDHQVRGHEERVGRGCVTCKKQTAQ